MAEASVGNLCEVWKSIPGWEGFYEVSDWGRVRSQSRPVRNSNGGTRTVKARMRKLVNHSAGYVQVGLQKEGVAETHLVHRLVALAFLGPCPVGTEVNHKDLNKHNNRIENLEYVTRSDNHRHAYRNGANFYSPIPNHYGEKIGTSKLTDDLVKTIITRCLAGEPQSVVARDYGVSGPAVTHIMSGATWKHIPRPDMSRYDASADRSRWNVRKGENHGSSKLTRAEAEEVIRRCAAGESHASVASRLGVGRTTVSMIARGENWAHLKRPD